MDEKRRCSWAGDVPVYVDYHDNEWGKPTHDDRMLFELLVLEGAQAGLWKTQADVPATTPLSDRISKDLKKRGFKFVGSTIVYAYLQSIGIVNDHVVDCFAYRELTS